MFTGIVERVGSVVWLEGGRLAVDPGDGFECAVGESVAVNGCCLTVASVEGGLQFDLSAETMRRTSVGGLKPGSKVNLERAVRADGRFGGHFVQGHVDAVGTLVSLERKGEGAVARFEAPTEFARYLVDKGSIAVDG
ncbi:MAG: riboflavin synthase, partial [Fimbriimonas ginsengisoli]|nr:riboflavin synthase [Fimbriimonas ginsengisoli]